MTLDRHLGVRVDGHTYRALARLARRQRVHESQLVRRALRELLERESAA